MADTEQTGTADEQPGDRIDVDALLAQAGFDPDRTVLTRRQAVVLALRERGLRQADIAARLGTSRANISGIESSARDNVERAHETVAVAEALSAPVRIEVEAGASLYDVPEQVYDAADTVGVKVDHSAPDLMKLISEGAGDAVGNRQVQSPLLIGVTEDGSVRVRRSET